MGVDGSLLPKYLIFGLKGWSPRVGKQSIRGRGEELNVLLE
jgi:hypothetical protein